jgi:hypothetical protein
MRRVRFSRRGASPAPSPSRGEGWGGGDEATTGSRGAGLQLNAPTGSLAFLGFLFVALSATAPVYSAEPDVFVKTSLFHPCSLEISWQDGDAQGLACDHLTPAQAALDGVIAEGARGVRAVRLLTERLTARQVRRAPTRASTPCLEPPARAPALTVFVFLDFDCAFCRAFRYRLYDLSRRHGARVCVKHFPVGVLERFPLPALASVAAWQQGLFFEMLDALYHAGGEVDEARAQALAAGIGLDVARFRLDLAGEGARALILRDTQEGARLGVPGTPTVVIGDELFTDFELLDDWVATHAARRRSGRPD